jgi:hypothetical protein
MSFAFNLERYKEGPYATIYTFRKEDQAENELNRFLSNPEVQANPDFGPLMTRLQDGLRKYGYNPAPREMGWDRWFRSESDDFRETTWYAEALWAPYPRDRRDEIGEDEDPPSLRLYCFRLHQLLIAGNGGVKDTQRPEGNLADALDDIRYVMSRVRWRLEREGTLRVAEEGFLFEGDTHFDNPDQL